MEIEASLQKIKKQFEFLISNENRNNDAFYL